MEAWRIRQWPLKVFQPVLAWDSITKYHKLSGLNNRQLFLSSWGWEVQDQVPADLVPGEGPLPDVQMAAFPCVLIWQREREGEKERGGCSRVSLLIKALIPSCGPHPRPASNHLPTPKRPVSEYHPLRIRVSTYKLWWEDSSVHST